MAKVGLAPVNLFRLDKSRHVRNLNLWIKWETICKTKAKYIQTFYKNKPKTRLKNILTWVARDT